MQTKPRKVYIDFLRIMATFLVIFNHLPGNYLYESSTGVATNVYLFISTFTKVNVPLFFMISGSMLLSKDEDYKTILKKRVLRIALVLVLFEIAAYLMVFLRNLLVIKEAHFSVKELFLSILAGDSKVVFQYWYLYAYLGFLLLLPFMRGAAKQMDRSGFTVLLVLKCLLAIVLPFVNKLLQERGASTLSLSEDFKLPLVAFDAFFYPLMGYYIDQKLKLNEWKGGRVLGLVILGIAAMVSSVLLTGYDLRVNGVASERYMDLIAFAETFVVFITVKWLFMQKECPERLGKVICSIGKLTFGIYLLDSFVKYLLYFFYVGKVERFLPTIVISYGWCIISMLLGGLITRVFKKLPGIKKLL